jgi:hypothetical protein
MTKKELEEQLSVAIGLLTDACDNVTCLSKHVSSLEDKIDRLERIVLPPGQIRKIWWKLRSRL